MIDVVKINGTYFNLDDIRSFNPQTGRVEWREGDALQLTDREVGLLAAVLDYRIPLPHAPASSVPVPDADLLAAAEMALDALNEWPGRKRHPDAEALETVIAQHKARVAATPDADVVAALRRTLAALEHYWHNGELPADTPEDVIVDTAEALDAARAVLAHLDATEGEQRGRPTDSAAGAAATPPRDGTTAATDDVMEGDPT